MCSSYLYHPLTSFGVQIIFMVSRGSVASRLHPCLCSDVPAGLRIPQAAPARQTLIFRVVKLWGCEGLLVALLTSTGGAEDFGGFAVVAFESQLECGFMEDERSGMHIGTGLDLPSQRQRGGHGFKLSKAG